MKPNRLLRFITPLLFLINFGQQAHAVFQVRFLGGALEESADSGSNIRKGTLFKTLISNGENFRFTGSFTYSQSTSGTLTVLQGEVGFGFYVYPHHREPVPFIQPFFHGEVVGTFGTEDETSNADPKKKVYNGSANIGVGMDINFSRTFGFIVGAEVHNFKQHRVIVGFLQGY